MDPGRSQTVAGRAARPAVAVSGIGIVSAAGIGIDETWERLRSAPPTPIPFTGPPPTERISFPAYVAPDYTLAALGVSERCRRWLDTADLREARDLRHAIAATALALTDAGLPLDCSAFDPAVAVIAANESPGFEELSRALFSLDADDPLPDDPQARFSRLAGQFFQLNTFLPPHYLGRAFGLRGQALFVNSACASGLNAIDVAAQAIRAGRCRLAVVAASDNPLSVAKFFWFHNLGLYAPDGVLRPFDRRQTGTVFGDGGAALVLEDRASAVARGARIYAECAGAGFAQDGWRITVPDPTRASGESALRGALDEAAVTPADVDLVVPHGVGTSASDRYEARLLHSVFAGQQVWPAVSALKPCIGHALGASALMETALLLAAMDRGEVPPTWGHAVPYDRHRLPLAAAWQTRRLDVAVKLTCAFAGYCAAMVFRRDAG